MVNTDDALDLVATYKIETVPTFLVVKDKWDNILKKVEGNDYMPAVNATILLTIFAGLSSALRIQTETPQHSFETGTHAK